MDLLLCVVKPDCILSIHVSHTRSVHEFQRKPQSAAWPIGHACRHTVSHILHGSPVCYWLCLTHSMVQYGISRADHRWNLSEPAQKRQFVVILKNALFTLFMIFLNLGQFKPNGSIKTLHLPKFNVAFVDWTEAHTIRTLWKIWKCCIPEYCQ